MTASGAVAELAYLGVLRRWRFPTRPVRRPTRPRAQAAPLPVPLHTDAAWRPDAWSDPQAGEAGVAAASGTGLGNALTLFHDCPRGSVTARQVPQPVGAAPCAVCLDLDRFAGSFLSFALDLPGRLVGGLGRGRILQVDLPMTRERPLEIFARLNMGRGPNTEQMLRSADCGGDGERVEFDLAYARILERRIERAWIDLIFATPGTTRIVLHDLVVSRRLRADV